MNDKTLFYTVKHTGERLRAALVPGRARTLEELPPLSQPVEVCGADAELPLLLDSPHSGAHRPADFHSDAPLPALLSGWDAFVDVLWMSAVERGGVLVSALFPRVYIDPNRAESDLDPGLLSEPWPEPTSPQAYSARGMGLIRRDALPGVPMYRTGLSVAAVRHRIEGFYRPYRQAVTRAAERAFDRHGCYWHLNCHSMKSRGNAMNVDSGAARPDVVISDRHGTTASPAFTQWVADFFASLGYRVRINDPYAGGDLIATHGDPARHRHSIQVEINRALYMDEGTFTPHAGFEALQGSLDLFCAALSAYIRQQLKSPPTGGARP